MSGFRLAELGVLAAELMERLHDDYGAKDGAELGVVAVVAEINYGGEEGVCVVEFRCSDNRRWVQHGLFAAAQRAVLCSMEHPGDDEK